MVVNPWAPDEARRSWHWYKFQNADYKPYNYFVLENSTGFTQAGLGRLNRSIKAYVYCVLGSQADTRVSIANSGGAGQETRQKMISLLEDETRGINEDDSIPRYQNVINATRVKLDLAISPSLWLIPSKMIINLNTNVAGYNNFLQQATEDMKFGYNNINNDVKESALKEMEGHDDPVERLDATTGVAEQAAEAAVTPEVVAAPAVEAVAAHGEHEIVHEYSTMGIIVGTIFLSYLFI